VLVEKKKTLIDKLAQYVKEAGLDKATLGPVVKTLLGLDQLPANPYPYIVRSLRLIEIRQLLWENLYVLRELEYQGSRPQLLNEDEQLAALRVNSDLTVYGLDRILRFVDPRAIGVVYDLVEEHIQAKVVTEGEYKMQVSTALIGEWVFFKRVHPHPEYLNYRDMYYVEGPRLEKALNLFVSNVYADVMKCGDDMTQYVLGFRITVPSKSRYGGLGQHTWSLEELEKKKKAFVTELKTAIVSRRDAFLDYVGTYKTSKLKDGRANTTFMRCRRAYAFYYREAPGKPIKYFEPEPWQTLQEGIYFGKNGGVRHYELCAEIGLASKRNTANPYHPASFKIHKAILTETITSTVARSDFMEGMVWALIVAAIEGREEPVKDIRRMLFSAAAPLRSLHAEAMTMELMLTLLANEETEEFKLEGAKEQVLVTLRDQMAGYIRLLHRVLEAQMSASLLRGIRWRTDVLCQRIQQNLQTGKDEDNISALGQTVLGAAYQISHDIASLSTDGVALLDEIVKDSRMEDERAFALKALDSLNGSLHRSRLVFDVESETKRLLQKQVVPSNLAREATLLHYAVNTELDKTCHEQIAQLFELKPNPTFPIPDLVAGFARVALVRGIPDASEFRSGLNKLEEVDKDHKVYQAIYLQDESREDYIYGSFNSLFLADLPMFRVLQPLLETIANKIPPPSSSVNMEISTGYGGDLTTRLRVGWPNVTPRKIQMVELYVVEYEDQMKSLRFAVNHMLDHIVMLHDETPHLLLYIRMTAKQGLSETQQEEIYMSQILQERASLVDVIARSARGHVDITLYYFAVVNKSYVPLQKSVRFYWKNPKTNKIKVCAQHDPRLMFDYAAYSLREAVAISTSDLEDMEKHLVGGGGEAKVEDFHKLCMDEYKQQVWQDLQELGYNANHLEAYSRLLRLRVIQGKFEDLGEIARMFRSPAEIANRLEAANSVLFDIAMEKSEEIQLRLRRGIVRYMLESLKRALHGFLEADESIFIDSARFYYMYRLEQVAVQRVQDRLPCFNEDAATSLGELAEYLAFIRLKMATTLHDHFGRVAEMLDEEKIFINF